MSASAGAVSVAGRSPTAAVPPSVTRVVSSPGVPLAPGTRTFFEQRFGHDFADVRVHAGPEAAASAAEVSARAYTVGDHIVLGPGISPTTTGPAAAVLGHELAHVIQDGGSVLQAAPRGIGPAESQAEREADQAATQALHDEPVTVGRRASGGTVRRQFSCTNLIRPDDPQATAGIGRPAHDAIEHHARSVFGAAFWQQTIPTASFTPWRTEDRDPRRRQDPAADEQVDPQGIGGRAGIGTPDLGYRAGPIVEIAEVKPAILGYGGLIEWEFQLLNYLEKGNSDTNRGWRGRRRIAEIVTMPPDRLSFPRSLTTSSGRQIAAAWCTPGLIGYRALSREESETIICGMSDQGMIDRFLDSGLDQAQGVVDGYVDSVGDAIARRVRTFTLREAVVVLSRHAQSALKKLIGAIGGSLVEAVVDELPDVEFTDWAAEWIADQLGGEAAEALLRRLALEIKTALMKEVRAWLKNRVRSYLQEAFAAACAAAAVGAVVSVADLLRRFGERLAEHFLDGVITVGTAWAKAMAKQLAKSVLIGILVAAAVVLLIFFLPEILAGVAAIGEVAVAAGAAAAALGPRLLQLVNEIVDAVMDALPAGA